MADLLAHGKFPLSDALVADTRELRKALVGGIARVEQRYGPGEHLEGSAVDVALAVIGTARLVRSYRPVNTCCIEKRCEVVGLVRAVAGQAVQATFDCEAAGLKTVRPADCGGLLNRAGGYVAPGRVVQHLLTLRGALLRQSSLPV